MPVVVDHSRKHARSAMKSHTCEEDLVFLNCVRLCVDVVSRKEGCIGRDVRRGAPERLTRYDSYLTTAEQASPSPALTLRTSWSV